MTRSSRPSAAATSKGVVPSTAALDGSAPWPRRQATVAELAARRAVERGYTMGERMGGTCDRKRSAITKAVVPRC